MKEQSILKKNINLIAPFLWPKNKLSLKIRVILALLCLVLSKATNLITPPILGRAVDSLTELSQGLNMYTLVPLSLIVAFFAVRK